MSAPVGPVRVRATRIAEQAVERARLAVVPKTVGRPPQVPFAVLIALALVGGVAGLLMFNTNMAAASFDATDLQNQVTHLEAREQHLKMQLARMQDPQRLAREARRLGMVPIEEPSFIRLKDGRVVGTPEISKKAHSSKKGADGTKKSRRVSKPEVLRPKPVYLPPTGSGESGPTSDGSGSSGGKKKPSAGQ